MHATNALIFIIILGQQDKQWRDITENNFKSEIGLIFAPSIIGSARVHGIHGFVQVSVLLLDVFDYVTFKQN